MPDMDVQCPCGAVTLSLKGEPAGQSYYHCDDCQRAHSAAYVPRAIYPHEAVSVVRGETRSWTNRTRRMTICAACGSHLYGDAQGMPFRGVNAGLFPPGVFQPQMHLQCQHAVAPVVDVLPHYQDWPAEYGGSGERIGW
jgi:hypothetical protein